MEFLPQVRWRRWALFVVGWATLSLLFAPEAYLSFYLRHSPISWQETLQLTVLNSAIALLFVPGIVYLARRYPLERKHLRAALLAHIPACLAFSVGHSVLYAIACHAWNDAGATLFYRFHPNLLTYWAVVGFTQAMEYFRKYQARERQVSQLQLEILKAQLQPHFLFNTLHTISSMMHVDQAGADRMLSHLSGLLRMTLANIGKHEARLADEIAFVCAYLEIEQERFGERLTLDVDVSTEAKDAMLPALFLQPLVENCIRHGFKTPRDDASISIRASREADRLILTVSDNGDGIPASAPIREGVGLTNSRKRLHQLYADDHSFSVRARSGVTIAINIPFHTDREQEMIADDYPGVDRGRRTVGAETDRFAAEQ